MDPRLAKLAKVLINYSLRLKKGQLLRISGEPAALPLIKATYAEAVNVGAHPYVVLNIADNHEYMLKHGSDEQIKFYPAHFEMEYKKMDAYLGIWGGDNTCYLNGVDPKKQSHHRLARKKLSDIFHKRAGAGELAWVGTQFPTVSDAQNAGMSLTDYENFVYGAGHLSAADPVKHWKKVQKEQERLVKVLDRVDQLHVRSNDTDLKMRVKGRKWINCCGRENFPDGEVFTGPIENSTEGKIRFSFPAVYASNEVEDVTLEFKRGRVANFSAARNEAFLKSMLDMDKGARFVGEFAIGTNYDIKQFSKNTLFDEKIGGTCHLAVGEAFPETGAKNRSALHWDMVCDLRKGGTIEADNKVIYRNGKFTI